MYTQFDQQVFYQWLDRFQLPANRTLRSFSKGMKALLLIVLALSTQARLILLDEPINGLYYRDGGGGIGSYCVWRDGKNAGQ
ncbi:ATP-binding cassette domain-containing protein [Paenibacillus agricola]|uniref:ATP-binding cassette domain-containing protein n=1 Tax=Paenibacillus agricola TaxID=2716264 RepID=A0ABX0JD48_9BACL|nr:ATP-binding cassette domain-containing protein [Paenibacillus agricola]NHN31841.1 ATP-binding cassette domain-containing protein [Paenibacillus agricola]